MEHNAVLGRSVQTGNVGLKVGETGTGSGTQAEAAAHGHMAAAQEAGAATINYGVFINTVLDFVIVAFAIFMVIRAMNKMQKQEEEKPAEPPKPSEEVLLLQEIRDALKKQ